MKHAKEYYYSLKVGDVVRTVGTGTTDDHGAGFKPNIVFKIYSIGVSKTTKPGQLIFWGDNHNDGIYETGILVPDTNNYEVF